jgi:hypothetical protein
MTTVPPLRHLYSVRHLDLHSLDPEQRASSKAGEQVRYPGPQAAKPEGPLAGNPGTPGAGIRLTAKAEPGPQTLVQPDIAHPAHLKEEARVPSLVIWAPKKEVVKNIVAPLPEPATASDVKPSLEVPNEEVSLTDLSVAASDTPSRLQFLPPSTTSPLVVHGPEKAQLPPVTASQTSAAPTPAAVMSLSDLRMKDGPVTLPPVNETNNKKEVPLTEGSAVDLSLLGQRNTSSPASGVGSGKSAVPAIVKKVTPASTDDPPVPASPSYSILPSAISTEAKTYPASVSPDATGRSDPPASRFTLPKDGQFGAVVVGTSLQEEYPEVSGLWGGQLAYTVYLHVGLEKSWILQYSIPQTAGVESGGNSPRLEAPWPYNIVRPNLAAGTINADALMVHGFVNEAGHFESLAVAFPPDFPEAQYVLSALAQWQFRPAAENGHPARVEVVLIIPEVYD